MRKDLPGKAKRQNQGLNRVEHYSGNALWVAAAFKPYSSLVVELLLGV